LAGVYPNEELPLAVASPKKPIWRPWEISWVPDAGTGPLAAIVAAMESSKSGLILVLAIDLPEMTSDYLSELRAGCAIDCGAEPHGDVGFEPVAAVFPANAASIEREYLLSGRRDLQGWVKDLQARGRILPRKIKPAERVLFTNWNRPNDLR